MNGENFLSKQQTTKGQTVMKDIDGQEIHVGDVVLILPYQAAFYKTTIGKVVNVDANIIVKFPKFIMTSCFKPEEIFCLFYRKPMPEPQLLTAPTSEGKTYVAQPKEYPAL